MSSIEPRVTREKDGGLTRQKIMGAALELFARQGYHQTSVTQIVEKADTYRSAIEWHFGGKFGLLAAVLDYYFEQKFIEDIRSRWSRFLGSHDRGDGKDAFHFFSREFSGIFQNNLGIIVALFTLTFEGMHLDPKMGERVKGAWDQISDTFRWITELGQKQGVIEQSIDPALLAKNSMALGQGIFVQWYLNPTPANARQSLHQFLKGLEFYLKIPVPEKIQDFAGTGQ